MSIKTRIDKTNLFNKEAISSGYINDYGTITSSPVLWHINDYIDILPNTTYTLTNSYGPTNIAMCWYDSNKTILYRNKIPSTTTLTATSPSNAVYVRVNFRVDGKNITQLEKGSTSTPYKSYYQDITKVYYRNLGDTSVWNKVKLGDIPKDKWRLSSEPYTLYITDHNSSYINYKRSTTTDMYLDNMYFGGYTNANHLPYYTTENGFKYYYLSSNPTVSEIYLRDDTIEHTVDAFYNKYKDKYLYYELASNTSPTLTELSKVTIDGTQVFHDASPQTITGYVHNVTNLYRASQTGSILTIADKYDTSATEVRWTQNDVQDRTGVVSLVTNDLTLPSSFQLNEVRVYIYGKSNWNEPNYYFKFGSYETPTFETIGTTYAEEVITITDSSALATIKSLMANGQGVDFDLRLHEDYEDYLDTKAIKIEFDIV